MSHSEVIPSVLSDDSYQFHRHSPYRSLSTVSPSAELQELVSEKVLICRRILLHWLPVAFSKKLGPQYKGRSMNA